MIHGDVASNRRVICRAVRKGWTPLLVSLPRRSVRWKKFTAISRARERLFIQVGPWVRRLRALTDAAAGISGSCEKAPEKRQHNRSQRASFDIWPFPGRKMELS